MWKKITVEGDTEVGVEGRRGGEWNTDANVSVNGTEAELFMSTVWC